MKFLQFPCSFLKIWQTDGKGGNALLALGGDSAAVELNNLPGDGQAKARASRPGSAGAVQTEELLKNAAQLLGRDGGPGVGEGESQALLSLMGGDVDLSPGRAVVAGVAQQVVEHPGQLVRVTGVGKALREGQPAGEPRLLQHGGKLAGHLPEHERQVHRPLLQLQVGEVEACDVEKLVDELLQPLRLVQGHPGVPGPEGGGDIGLVPQEGEIADDAGQRGFQVVGQIDDQVVFPLLRLPGGHGVPQSPLPEQVQLVLNILHSAGQEDRCFVRMSQLLRRVNDFLQLLLGAGNKIVADGQPPHGVGSQKHQKRILPHPVQQVPERGPFPPELLTDAPAQKEHSGHGDRPKGQQRDILQPEQPALPGPGNQLILQWYTPPPTRS